MHFHNWMHSSTSGQVSVFLSASVLLHLDLINLIMQHDEFFMTQKGLEVAILRQLFLFLNFVFCHMLVELFCVPHINCKCTNYVKGCVKFCPTFNF